jgi:tripartite-type tricarboxylate transporter receptor subunit TctC
LRALGVTTAQRVPALPDVAPLAEVGVPNYDASSWHTVTTTAGVPKPIVDKLHAELRAIMADPAVVEQLSKEGTLPQVSPSPEELKRFVESEITRWGAVVQKAGIAGSE